METHLKHSDEARPGRLVDNLNFQLLRNHVLSSLYDSLKLSALFFIISVQACCILNSWEPICHLLPLSLLLMFLALKSFLSKPPEVYLVNFSCLRPPSQCRVPISAFIEHASIINCFDKESVAFMAKIIAASGQGDETYLPQSLHYIPPKTHHTESITEVHMVLFTVMDDLLSKTMISPRDIDILVVNCSGFCPSPSLSSIVVNRYAMRADIKSFNLSGMGCSASAIGVDVASNLLRVHKDSYAVVLSTEILSTGWYSGKDRRKLLLNCLFRMGCAAVLLTNRKEAKETSKYKLNRVVRTQRAFDDKAYLSGIREEDSQGITGFSIEPNLLKVAEETLRQNIIELGSSILPFREKILYGSSLLRKKFMDRSDQVYVPDFGSAIQHYCLPSAGKAIIREIGKGLKLKEEETEAAMMTLHRFGNQSSSSMWYELGYMEAKGRVKEGDKVWQLGMGSGPKCNSVVWECIRRLDYEEEKKKGPWYDCIDRYPIGSGKNSVIVD